MVMDSKTIIDRRELITKEGLTFCVIQGIGTFGEQNNSKNKTKSQKTLIIRKSEVRLIKFKFIKS